MAVAYFFEPPCISQHVLLLDWTAGLKCGWS